jgi:hypothetical protein
MDGGEKGNSGVNRQVLRAERRFPIWHGEFIPRLYNNKNTLAVNFLCRRGAKRSFDH